MASKVMRSEAPTRVEFLVGLCRSIFILASAIGYCSVLSASCPAGELGKANLSEKPIEILGGRLSVRMPQGAKTEARLFNIMSAPESEEHETRVVFDEGQERLVLMAHELFAFAGDDFEKDVRGWVANWHGKYVIETLRLSPKELKAIKVFPLNGPDHSRSDDAAFVEGVFVESADGTIQSVDVYVNSVAEKDLEGCKAVAQRILLSVAPGKKHLQLAAGERRLFAYSKDLRISIMVPKNTVATRQDGPDFLVHRLIVLGRLGADSGSIGIYVGGHPSFKPGTKKGEGVIFGKNIEWHTNEKGEGLEVLCKLTIPDDDGLFAHVWVHAPIDAQLGELKKVAESMKLVGVKEPVSR